MDYLSVDSLLYTSEKYEDIYADIREKCDIKYQDLFLLLASIGFKNNRREKRIGQGREFRTTFWKEKDKSLVYTILLSDNELNLSVDDITDKSRFKEFNKVLEEYAEGGMSILVEEVLPVNIEENTKSKRYEDYILDILSYVYGLINEVPF